MRFLVYLFIFIVFSSLNGQDDQIQVKENPLKLNTRPSKTISIGAFGEGIASVNFEF